ncbi:MAG: hypothetical protein JNJ77_11815 [Planctomycetia bacterium]|nr:hypothetical protein [Planctomycetia bacterium]
MQARGWSAGGLRSLLLITGFLISSSYVTAGDVHLDHRSVQGQVGTAGKYTFTQIGGSPTLPTYGNYGGSGRVETFCISLATTILDPGWYTTTDDITNLPTPNGPMGLLTARRISVLVNEVLNGNKFGTGDDYNDAGTPTNGWASVQGAIWRLINPLANIPGGLAVSDVNNLISGATTILAGYGNDLAAYYAGTGYLNNYYIHGLDAYKLNSNGSKNYRLGQDQIYWDTNPNFIIQVPVPAGVVLAGMGMICLGGFNLYRRRKIVIAA